MVAVNKLVKETAVAAVMRQGELYDTEFVKKTQPSRKDSFVKLSGFLSLGGVGR